MTNAVHDQTGTREGLLQACHELQQPVASVLTLAMAALAAPGLAPGTRLRLAEIVAQASWQADMIDDFVQAGTGDLSEGSGHCSDVVAIVNDAIKTSCATWPGRVAVTSPAGPVGCGLRPVLLRRVVQNLLGNAMRAAGPSGTVAIHILHKDGMAMLSVQDSGPGFGKVPKRNGIGLAAVARIITRYEGGMEYGRDAASGARVRLWLP